MARNSTNPAPFLGMAASLLLMMMMISQSYAVDAGQSCDTDQIIVKIEICKSNVASGVASAACCTALKEFEPVDDTCACKIIDAFRKPVNATRTQVYKLLGSCPNLTRELPKCGN